MSVFVDASFLIALFHQNDFFHQKATEIIQKLEQNSEIFITSKLSVAEGVNYIFRHQGPKTAEKFLKTIRKSGLEEVEINNEIFEAAYNLLFKQKNRKCLNFFDCLHLATMNFLEIKNILTFDQHFRRHATILN